MTPAQLKNVFGTACLAMIACLLLTPSAVAQVKASYRAWTSAKGDTVNAVFVSDADGYVHLRKTDGKTVRIKRADLSKADQAYLDGLRNAAAAEPGTPAPAPAGEQAASDFLPEDTPMPAATDPAGVQWSIGQAVVCSNFDGQHISNTYTQKFDTFYCYRKVPAGYRLIVVKCSIKALTKDPEAIDKLNKLRAPQADKLPFIGKNMLISEEQRKQLTGEYRLLNATNITLVADTPRRRFTALWLVLPPAKRGAYFLETGGDQPFFGGVASKPPWYKTLTVMNGFTGLLEVGKPASVALFYGIPVDIDPGTLRLSVEGQGGMLLSIEEKKGLLGP